MLTDNKRVEQELRDIKNNLIDNELKNANFDTLELTQIVNDDAFDQENAEISNKLNKDITMKDIIVDILKPELKEWLNKNLPDIVRESVDKEIKKILPKNE